MEKIKLYLIQISTSVRDAMKKMDENHTKNLFVVDADLKLIGSLSDGDLRRWILSEGKLDERVDKVANKTPIYFNEGYSVERVKEIMLEKKIQCIPVLDHKGQVNELLFWDNIFGGQHIARKRDKLDAHIVIMAGGMGTRLEPFTQILPKPLIPIGDKTIIEVIIDKFLDYNIKHFHISIGHKSKIIRSYFEDLDIDYTCDFIYEDKPLGTIGSVSKLKGKTSAPIIVTNCDIVIEADYSELLNFHKENKYDLTLVGSLMHYKIPYGICEIEQGGKLVELKEKPEYSMLVSTGMYVLSEYAVSKIPVDQHFHVTQLMELLRSEGKSVGVFPISEKSWFDTGEWKEYHSALHKMGFK